jgi:hypothetical protein
MESAVRFLFMAGTALLLVQLAKASPQDLDTLISQVFKRPATGGNLENPQSTEEKNEQSGDKIQSEAEDHNPLDCQCVPYYLCQNNTIVQDGHGLIDIRLGTLHTNQQCLCPASNSPG